MKINFGIYKNHTLKIGKNFKMRPTQSIVKSTIFNIIKINDSDVVLDLFAGTGALGFESMSLGAKKVFWSDNNDDSWRAISFNIKKFNLNSKNFKVFKTDFRMVLKKIDFKPTVIFIDPPFIAKNYFDEALKIIVKNNLLENNGVIVMERPLNLEIESLNLFSRKKIKSFGKKELIFLWN